MRWKKNRIKDVGLGGRRYMDMEECFGGYGYIFDWGD